MQQADRNVITLTGELQWMCIEGGFWTLNAEGKVYDLHSDRSLFKEFQSGDKVEVRGIIRKDMACFHMRGVIFELESIKHSSQQ